MEIPEIQRENMKKIVKAFAAAAREEPRLSFLDWAQLNVVCKYESRRIGMGVAYGKSQYWFYLIFQKDTFGKWIPKDIFTGMHQAIRDLTKKFAGEGIWNWPKIIRLDEDPYDTELGRYAGH